MKKKKKSFILLGIAAFAILMATNINTNQYTITVNKYEPKAYNYNPTNVLDNVFIQNNKNIIPFIFTNPDQTIEKNKIISEFTRKGLTITNNINNNIVGTGTEIKASDGKTYTILVYGDVNGDGKVNLIDAQKVVFHHKGKSTLSGIYFTAGNVANNNSTINLIDAQRIVMLKKNSINKLLINEPVSLMEADKIAPVITLNGQENVIITLGDNYIEQGARAIDNYDGEVRVNISGTINKNAIGTYTITYTATDTKGNKATKERKVHVVDGIKDIEMSKNPTKNIYEYDEANNLSISNLNVNGAKILVTMKSGNTYTKNIEKSMLTTENNLTTPGVKTITVTYEEITTTFTIKILNPITTLTVNENENENITVKNSLNYAKLNTNFILGTISVNTGIDITPLKIEQLKAEIKVLQNNQKVDTNDLNITFNQNGEKTLVQGTASRTGLYYITPYIQYEDGKVVKAETIELKVKSENPVLNNVKLSVSKLKLYLEESEETKVEADENIYTVLPIKFFDQDGDSIEIKASNIIINGNAEQGKVNITLPEIRKDSTSNETNSNAIIVKLYNAQNQIASNNDVVCKVGFAINQNTEIYYGDVSNNIVKIEGGNTIINLPINLQLKKLTKINVTQNSQLQKDEENYYNLLGLNQEYVLGQVTSNSDEEEIKLEELSTNILSNNNQINGIDISYVNIGNGIYEIRATVLKEGLYQITPKVNGIVGKNIFVKCILTITDVSIGTERVQIMPGEEAIYTLTVKSNINPEGGHELKLNDIKVPANEEIEVMFLNSEQVQITNNNETISYIKIIADENATIGTNVQIILDVLEGKYQKTIQVQIADN